MSPDNRVVMIDTEKTPNREELLSEQKMVTAKFFEGFKTSFGGYIITSKAKLAVQWFFDPKDMDSVIEYLKQNSLEGFDPEVHKDGILVKIY